MKILEEFDGSLLSNEDKFQDPFYKRFQLKKRKVQLSGAMEKEYDFPTLYGDVTCAQAIFLCSFDAALAMMPHPAVRPVRALKKHAVMAVSCYEYKNVLGIPPYNEIAFTFAVDVEKEKARLTKELTRLTQEISRIDGKLANEGYMAKAPAHLIEAEREKRQAFAAMLEKVEAELNG